MPRFNRDGMIECPTKMSEGWYRKMVARQETVDVNGQSFTLQSVSPRWYLEQNDRCGMTGDRKDTARYMDLLFKNCVIAPAQVSTQGLAYFEELGDIETPELLVRAIELFLRPGKRPGGSAPASKGQ